MKKKLALLMGAVLTAGAFGGCSGGGNNQESGDVLTWYVPGDKQVDMKLVMDEVNKIIEPEIGAKLDLQPIDTGSYTENMKMKMAAGENFDLMFTGWVNNYISAVQLGGLLDITDMIDQYAPKLKDVVEDYALDQARVDGKIYAIPNIQIMALKSCVWVRADLAEEYGLKESEVDNIDDIEPFLEWCSKNHPEVYPFKNDTGLRPWTQTKYYYPEDGYCVEKDKLLSREKPLEVVRETDTKEYKDAVYKLWDWYQKGYIRKDILTVMDDSGDYSMGKYGVIYSSWKPGAESNIKSKAGADYIPFILQKNEKVLLSGVRDTMTGISKTSKNPEKAMKLIELVNTNRDVYNMICFGIEGKHYNINDEGKAVVVENSGYNLSPNAWIYGCQYNLIVSEGQDSDVWEKTKQLNDEGIVNPLANFAFNKDNVATEIASVSTIFDQYAVTKIGAQNPDEYYDEMVTKLDNAGQKKIVEELDKQINEFLTNKEE